MTCSRKLLVVESSRRPNLRMPRKWSDSIPFIENMPGHDDDPGLIEQADGGLRCVVKVSGQSLTFLESEHEQVAATFERVLGCIDSSSELQFLTTNKPIDPDACLDSFREMGQTEDPYLDWYADYTSKWFRRVCEVAVIPRKDFFIVVTERKSVNQAKRLKRRVADVMDVLGEGGLSAQLLNRSEVRQLLYSCMRLSYSTGLTEQPVETLTDSSLPKVGGTSSKNHLVVDGQFVSSHVLSDLPSKAKLGWLMNLMVVDILSSFSLHIRKADSNGVRKSSAKSVLKKLEQSECEFYEFSFYATTFADSIEKLEEYRKVLKLNFKQQGALLSPEYDQYSAWISTLPVGIDCGGIAHCIPLDSAKICWPFFTEKCGSISGFPLGFARCSREPVFLRPTEMSNVSVLASTRKDLRFFHSILTVRMLTTDCHVLYLDNGQNEMSMLFEVLGPNLINDLRSPYSGHGPKHVENASMTLMSMCKAKSQNERERFRDAIRSWHKFYRSKKSLVIVVSEVNQLEDVNSNFETLLFLFELAKRNDINIIVGGLTSGTMISGELAAIVSEHADVKMVLPMTQKGQAQVAKMFSLNQGEARIVKSVCKDEPQMRYVSCFLRTNENRGVVRITPSPMDYWLCMPANSDLNRKIKKMKVELRRKNPKLSDTDLARQTVYYLGLQS